MGTAFSFSCSSAKGLGRGLTGISGSSSSSSPVERGERDVGVSFYTLLLPWLLCSEPNHEPPASQGGGRPALGWARGQQQSPARVPPFLQAGSRFELSAWKLPEMGPGARLGLAIVSSVSGLGSQRLQCSRAGGGGVQGGDTRETVPGEKPAPASSPHRPRTLTREVSRGVGVLHLVDVRLKLINFQLSEGTQEWDGGNRAGFSLTEHSLGDPCPLRPGDRGPLSMLPAAWGQVTGRAYSLQPGDRRLLSVPVSHPGSGSQTHRPSSHGASQDAAPLHLVTAPPASSPGAT